jgi:hypothetical protein
MAKCTGTLILGPQIEGGSGRDFEHWGYKRGNSDDDKQWGLSEVRVEYLSTGATNSEGEGNREVQVERLSAGATRRRNGDDKRWEIERGPGRVVEHWGHKTRRAKEIERFRSRG